MTSGVPWKRLIGWLMWGNFVQVDAKAYWRPGEMETTEVRDETSIEASPD